MIRGPGRPEGSEKTQVLGEDTLWQGAVVNQ